jgi:hypothetical protein
VLTAIDFDHQLVLGTGEVDYKVADRVLPAEFVAQQPAVSQCRPHSPFGIRRGLSQPASFPVGHRRKLPDFRKQTAEIPSPASLRSPPSPAMRERG